MVSARLTAQTTEAPMAARTVSEPGSPRTSAIRAELSSTHHAWSVFDFTPRLFAPFSD
jgi:hypothetical protein